MGEWIGIIEVSRILGIAPNTVRKLVQKGVLPAYEIKGVQGMQFKREDVEGLIQRVVPKEPPKPNRRRK